MNEIQIKLLEILKEFDALAQKIKHKIFSSIWNIAWSCKTSRLYTMG